MNTESKKVIRSFRDLDVFQNTYKASVVIATHILPRLPIDEKFDLKSQLSRSSKAVPRLIAEGYAKKHQKFGFQEYLDDAIGECNETIVSLEHVKDIYRVESELCVELVELYDKSARQLFRLAEAWIHSRTGDEKRCQETIRAATSYNVEQCQYV